MEGSEAPRNLGQDSDSDEGIAGGAEAEPEPAFNPHDAPTPTAEEGEYSPGVALHRTSAGGSQGTFRSWNL